MPRNDLSVVVGQGQNFAGGDNHPVDFAAGAGVDDRVKAVKKSVAHVNHVSLLEVNVDVGVRMRRLEILQHHDFTVGLQFSAAAECLLRQSIRGRCRNVQTQKRTVVGLCHARLGVFVGQHGGAGGGQICVIGRVVEMPVRVDH